jgi:putative salt-induced outer membrane protein YdiY
MGPLPPAAVIGGDGAGTLVPQVGGEPIMPGPLVMTESVFTPPWYHPSTWFGPYWDGSVELGLNGQNGNSNSESLRVGFDVKRETLRTAWESELIYNKTKTEEIETQNNAFFRSHWDLKLSNPRWTAFAKLGLEYDEFKDFDLRLFFNGGLGYYFVQTPITTLRGRFGSGVSREIGGVDEEWKPEAAFGLDLEHQLSKRQKLKITNDYYPNWTEFSDYRLVTDASWQLMLDAAANLSLKVSALNRYDSTPNGAKANDLNYGILLLWAF